MSDLYSIFTWLNTRYHIRLFICCTVLLSCEKETTFTTIEQTVDMLRPVASDMLQDGSMMDEERESVTGVDPTDCDPLQPSHCTLPWPSDHFLKTTSQGERRFRFSDESLPQNFQGVSFDPSSQNRLDGYGLLATGIVYFEGLDYSLLPNETEIAQSMNGQSTVALVELRWDEANRLSVHRLPCWAEVDLRASLNGPRALFVRPATLLKPNHQYAYILSSLKNINGELIEPSPAFGSLRDGIGSFIEGDRLISSQRREHYEELFDALEEDGIVRDNLTLAWRFQTASSDALSGDLLAMRDKGLDQLDEDGFNATVNEVIEYRRPDEPLIEDDERRPHSYIAAEVRGVMSLPYFMESDGFLNGEYKLRRDDQGIPKALGTVDVPFWLRIPHRALSGEPMGVIIYGHGQLYSGAEVRMGDKGPVAEEGGYLYLGTDMWGMSEKDILFIPLVLNQMDRFRAIAERLHQGIFNTLALARLAKRELSQLSWLQDHEIFLDQDKIVYGGISQGGIFGATVLALSQDITRGHLGVPGLHYFTLIGRSRNFSSMFTVLSSAYPDPIERWIALAAAQLLWNQTDPSSYYRHISENLLPDTPSHVALLTPAQGDPQVSQLTIEHLSRSDVGIPLLVPYGESIPPLAESTTYPRVGSGIVAWHYGPRTPMGAGPAPEGHHDPHEQPRNDEFHNQQMIHFWNTGEILDVCQSELCGDWRATSP